MHEGSGSDDTKWRKVDFLVVKHLEWLLHLDRLVQSPVPEVRSRHQQLSPHGRWNTAIYEYVPNHGAQSSPHGHIHLLQCIGGGKLLDKSGLQAVLPKHLPGVLAALVGAPTNAMVAEGNDCRPDKQFKQLKNLVLVGQQLNGGPLGVLVGYLANVLVAA